MPLVGPASPPPSPAWGGRGARVELRPAHRRRRPAARPGAPDRPAHLPARPPGRPSVVDVDRRAGPRRLAPAPRARSTRPPIGRRPRRRAGGQHLDRRRPRTGSPSWPAWGVDGDRHQRRPHRPRRPRPLRSAAPHTRVGGGYRRMRRATTADSGVRPGGRGGARRARGGTRARRSRRGSRRRPGRGTARRRSTT